jgi:hypothetical protein
VSYYNQPEALPPNYQMIPPKSVFSFATGPADHTSPPES